MRARPRPISPEPSKVNVAGSGMEEEEEVEKKYCSLSTNVATPDVAEAPAMLPLNCSLIRSDSVAVIVPAPVKAVSAAAAIVDADVEPEPVKLTVVEEPATPFAAKERMGEAPESDPERLNTTGSRSPSSGFPYR
jgi:hypothetical protein